MNWQEVTEHPSLRDLPFKIELNEYGAVVMNPVKLNHSGFQRSIQALMELHRVDGMALPEVAIWTRKGTKVADVAWVSLELWAELENQTEAMVAPEICVEVLSMSNSVYEMTGKRKLYFEQGAREVWICDEYGEITFYNEKRKLKKSIMFPDFPAKIKIQR